MSRAIRRGLGSNALDAGLIAGQVGANLGANASGHLQNQMGELNQSVRVRIGEDQLGVGITSGVDKAFDAMNGKSQERREEAAEKKRQEEAAAREERAAARQAGSIPSPVDVPLPDGGAAKQTTIPPAQGGKPLPHGHSQEALPAPHRPNIETMKRAEPITLEAKTIDQAAEAPKGIKSVFAAIRNSKPAEAITHAVSETKAVAGALGPATSRVGFKQLGKKAGATIPFAGAALGAGFAAYGVKEAMDQNTLANDPTLSAGQRRAASIRSQSATENAFIDGGMAAASATGVGSIGSAVAGIASVPRSIWMEVAAIRAETEPDPGLNDAGKALDQQSTSIIPSRSPVQVADIEQQRTR